MYKRQAVAEPKNVIAPIGTMINDVIAFCGGYKKEPRKILMGGPMMGRAIFSDEMPIVKKNNAIDVYKRQALGGHFLFFIGHRQSPPASRS